jgi:hypothetical protein
VVAYNDSRVVLWKVEVLSGTWPYESMIAPSTCTSGIASNTSCRHGIANHAFHLAMQSDGNLVLYQNLTQPVWDSGSQGRGTPPYDLWMQHDGNLVIYDANMNPTWASNTAFGAHRAPYDLILDATGQLRIIDRYGVVVRVLRESSFTTSIDPLTEFTNILTSWTPFSFF